MEASSWVVIVKHTTGQKKHVISAKLESVVGE